jgi:adenosylhomocysteine nucleosidase
MLKKGPIAIVSAMREELHELIERMNADSITVGSRVFWRANWLGHDVIAVMSGIGKVAAATTVATLIERFDVAEVLFSGVAGGLADQVKVGDVVVAKEMVQHDFDASPLFPRYEIPLYGQSHFTSSTLQHEWLVQAAKTCLSGLSSAMQEENVLDSLGVSLRNITIHEGLVVSGDQFIANNIQREDLRARLPLALAAEMEGAAVAQVCFDFKVPFAAVRVISDRADDQASVNFTHFIEKVAAPYGAHVMQSYLEIRPHEA